MQNRVLAGFHSPAVGPLSTALPKLALDMSWEPISPLFFVETDQSKKGGEDYPRPPKVLKTPPASGGNWILVSKSPFHVEGSPLLCVLVHFWLNLLPVAACCI